MASMFPIIFVLVIILGLMVCGYLFVPKGAQQTTIRTAILLTLASCYLMWMITYMAQLHPLIGWCKPPSCHPVPTYDRVDTQCLLNRQRKSDKYQHSVLAIAAIPSLTKSSSV
ncbi:ATP synthase subunit H-domain-containing protein [Boletus reticuloceps]|uniref:ATP synthase subunit H-domain-containing protein n=1 Tax=Boletus reticuloceps TaxID=495285 RepID=A0A8I3A799_9AGAM|nr:ATP synthase subunit H-domain-containing protein [Boletus reticuloceps]